MSETVSRQAAAELASQHTQSFPLLLRQLGMSVAVSTYQAGQLILLRDQGDGLNTHFVPLQKPMGMARREGRLTIGTDSQIWSWYNMPAVAPKIEPTGKHDAALVPRTMHVTGDIDIHEMAFADDGELWFVNTRMSCLCTLAPEHSIVPRWRPPFVTQFDLTDRCHLNGLAMRDGKAAYVTALGTTDKPGGWRDNKAAGGMLMRLSDETIIADGLSMPHSPRWYDGKLWVLESGAGALCTIDHKTGEKTTIIELPGFTRGIDFAGRYAFIGLSQVRETAVFAGLPLTERVSDRHCGVWVVDLQQRSIVAYAIFTGKVQEIFAITVLPWRYPALLEITDPRVRTSYSLPEEAIAQFAKIDPLAEKLAQATGLHQQRKLDDAIAAYRAILDESPEHKTARFQLGLALTDAERWPDAVEELSRVVEQQPRNAEAHNSLGLAYARLSNETKAIEHFDLAIDADQQFALAHFNRGLIQLRMGDFKNGWEGYEWRWQMPTFTPFRCPQPLWNGEDISGKTLLVHTEQGNGDAMQFARFLPAARARCAKLVLVCTPNMKAIMGTCEGIDEIRQPGQLPADSFEVYCPILSLPRALGITREDLPATQVPYLHVPPRTLVPDLDGDGFKVGLVWTGSTTQKDNHLRSCPLDELLKLTDLRGVQFYSLQKPLPEGAAEKLAAASVDDLEKDGTGYGYTAAYVEKLDLVISVCTSVAHLTGALAKPVWVILPHYADWRWGTGGDTTPWYRSMRLMRQTTPGDWPELIARVRTELARTADVGRLKERSDGAGSAMPVSP